MLPLGRGWAPLGERDDERAGDDRLAAASAAGSFFDLDFPLL